VEGVELMAGPFVEDVDSQYGGAVVMDDGDTGGMVMMDLGSPAVPLASMILALVGLKFLTESNLVSLDVSEVKVSFLNIVNIGLQAVVFIIMLKLAAAGLLRRGIVVPGLNDLAGAI